MKRFPRSILYMLLSIIILSPSVFGQSLPTVTPEDVGLSFKRLGRINTAIQGYIDQKQLAGAVTLVARRGKTAHLKAHGMMDIEAGKPMRTDAIFRIASMSKPITSTAVMILYEEGRFLLSDPVSKYIPEFKNPQVLVPSSSGDDYTLVPAKGEITVRHLLNHTSGISYQWNEWVGKMYHDAGITHGLLQDEGTIVEKMKLLAKVPLVQHPGEAWHYGLNIDVLGALVEIWSGMTLDEFLRDRLFEPLGMNDTHFFLPEEKVSRLVTVYAPGEGGEMKRWPEEPVVEGSMVYSTTYPYKGPRRYYSGGGGLSSTASDYARFLQMALNMGELNGIRVLSRKTVELMTTNSIGDMIILGQPGFKFGLGFSVRTGVSPRSELESVGNFGWGGFWFTHSFVDPGEAMIGIIMAQLKNAKEPIGSIFVNLATQAVGD